MFQERFREDRQRAQYAGSIDTRVIIADAARDPVGLVAVPGLVVAGGAAQFETLGIELEFLKPVLAELHVSGDRGGIPAERAR